MTSVLNYPHIGILILAWFVADLTVPILIRASHRLGLLDRPGGHKGQTAPVPFLGGVAIFLAFTVSVCSTLRFGTIEEFYPLLGMLVGGAVVVTLGLMDDFRPINAVLKLIVLFITTLVLASFGVHLQLFPDVLWNLPNILATLLWIVGVTSATNSLDNTDGVVGGVSAIASIFVFVIAWGQSPADAQPWLSYLALAVAGSALGFLRYNFNPAKIYLGDNGAFFLGFILATMLVFAEYSSDPIKAILVPAVILSVPIFDIVLATVLRIRDGDVRSIRDAVVYCGQDHIAHLLLRQRLTKTQATLAIYGLALLGGGTALLILAVGPAAVYLSITGIYLSFLIAVGIVLGRVRTAPREAIFSASPPSSPLEVPTAPPTRPLRTITAVVDREHN